MNIGLPLAATCPVGLVIGFAMPLEQEETAPVQVAPASLSDDDTTPKGSWNNDVTLPRVSLGGTEAHDVPAIVVPEGLPVSLLGQSFLSHVGKVAIAGDTMVLSQ